MSHTFDRNQIDPYAEAAHQVTQRMDQGNTGIQADAEEQPIDVLSNAVVTALGDIGAAAYRHGINDPDRLAGLAEAINALSKNVLLAYRGEVDSEPVFQALLNDPRLEQLPPEPRDKLLREINNTREYEALATRAKRLPDLLDLAGSLGLYVADEVSESGTQLLGEHPTPTADTTST